MQCRTATPTAKAWGVELLLVNGSYCGKVLRFNPCARGSLHYHEQKQETFYVLQGTGDFEYHRNGMRITLPVRPGDVIGPIEPRHAHRVTAGAEGLSLVEVSTTHDDADVVRLEPSASCP